MTDRRPDAAPRRSHAQAPAGWTRSILPAASALAVLLLLATVLGACNNGTAVPTPNPLVDATSPPLRPAANVQAADHIVVLLAFSRSPFQPDLKVAKLGGKPVTYDASGKLTRAGDTEVSYGSDGQISQIGEAKVTYDADGKPKTVGTEEVVYASTGRIANIGTSPFDYDAEGRAIWLGGSRVEYDDAGKVAKIGAVEVEY